MNPVMAAQYQQQQRQQYQRVQHQSQVRRGQVGPPAMTPDQHRLQTQKKAAFLQDEAQRQERDRERIKAAKPTDKTMPDNVEKLIVGDGVQQYKRLCAVERRLDAVMMRKYLDAGDSVEGRSGFSARVSGHKKLKIWISNTAENQPWQENGMGESTFDFNMGDEASYKVKIQGQLIDEDEEDESVADADEKKPNGEDYSASRPETADGPDSQTRETGSKKEAPSLPGHPRLRTQQRTKLSHFFKSITVDFHRDKNLQPEQMTQVEWKKAATNSGVANPASDFDSLEFDRKSDENINCTINLYWDEPPDRERFLLDKPLSELLDTEVEDRASIIMHIWEYVKAMGLQHDENKRQIHCDDRMKAVFDRDIIHFPHISSMLQQHLFPLPPVSIPYAIRVDPNYNSLPPSQKYTIYTLLIPDSLSPSPLPNRFATPDLHTLARKDDHLAELIQAISSSQRKHAFFSQLAKDPVGFTKRWMESQRKDLEIIMGEDGNLADEGILSGEWAKGGEEGVWGKDEVREAVNVMVQRPDKAGRAF